MTHPDQQIPAGGCVFTPRFTTFRTGILALAAGALPSLAASARTLDNSPFCR
jgi:hypothetical protein